MQANLKFDVSNRQIIDSRVPTDKILWGQSLSVCYTLNTDDVTKGEKPANTPYLDRVDKFRKDGDVLVAEETKSILTVENIKNNGLLFHLTSSLDNLSEYGINLPFNFMSKKGGGEWKDQFLFNSPYFSREKNILYIYLTKPNGGNLVVAVLGAVDGWKMDYSAESFGHFFVNLKLLKNFDKAYGKDEKKKELKFAIFPVENFSDCLDKLADFYEIPFLNYVASGGSIGEYIRLIPHGKIDKLYIKNKTEKETEYIADLYLENSKETEIIPVYNEKRGAEITVYGYDDLIALYKKSMDSVDLSILKNSDENLCEVQCWMSAMLRFLYRYKHRLSKCEVEIYEGKLRKQLSIITETDETKAVPRLTILNRAYTEFPPYHIFESFRIQEQVFGVTIFLDAFKYFAEEKYYEYAVNSMECLIDTYQAENGSLQKPEPNGKSVDYTTVCCPMIPLVDMAIFLKERDKEKSEKFILSAERMASFLYERGLSFPTEGMITDKFETEMEEGSISCSALSLLYFCKKVRRVEKYIKKAKDFLDLHENWVIQTPICQMKNSTLRWWETLWEGDADGPCICAGHAWTIWRAEADYLYYSLTGNYQYLIKAKNGFISNLSKIDEAGNSYSNYCPDLITGGGFAVRAEDVKFRVANRFPDRVDCGLSRYVWIRLNDTLLKEENNKYFE